MCSIMTNSVESLISRKTTKQTPWQELGEDHGDGFAELCAKCEIGEPDSRRAESMVEQVFP